MTEPSRQPPTRLVIEPNMTDPDGFYEALILLHQDLDQEQSGLVNAKLILLLANHIGDRQILDEAMALARET